MLGNTTAGFGRMPVIILCVPRSCAASPWVMERMTASLSATLAVFFRFSENRSPVLVFTVLNGPRYSAGERYFGSQVS